MAAAHTHSWKKQVSVLMTSERSGTFRNMWAMSLYCDSQSHSVLLLNQKQLCHVMSCYTDTLTHSLTYSTFQNTSVEHFHSHVFTGPHCEISVLLKMTNFQKRPVMKRWWRDLTQWCVKSVVTVATSFTWLHSHFVTILSNNRNALPLKHWWNDSSSLWYINTTGFKGTRCCCCNR